MTTQALRFGAATSDCVNCGSAANITGFQVFSGGVLAKVTTRTAARQFCSKVAATGGTGFNIELADTTGNVNIAYNGSTGMGYLTNSNPIALNTWQFIVWTCDTSLGAGLKAHLYASPNLTGAIKEATYGTLTEGSGFVPDAAGDAFLWGNYGTLVLSLQGSIALGFHAPGVILSLAEAAEWQRRPFFPPRGSKLFSVLGRDGRGLVRDWSQTGGHTGTITGAIAVEGPPDYAPQLPWRLLRTFVAGPQATDDVLIRVGNMSLTEHSGLVTPLFTASGGGATFGGVYRRRRLAAFENAQ